MRKQKSHQNESRRRKGRESDKQKMSREKKVKKEEEQEEKSIEPYIERPQQVTNTSLRGITVVLAVGRVFLKEVLEKQCEGGHIYFRQPDGYETVRMLESLVDRYNFIQFTEKEPDCLQSLPTEEHAVWDDTKTSYSETWKLLPLNLFPSSVEKLCETEGLLQKGFFFRIDAKKHMEDPVNHTKRQEYYPDRPCANIKYKVV